MLVTKGFCRFGDGEMTLNTIRRRNRPRIGSSGSVLIESRRGDSMTNLAGVVQQLRKERDRAARTVEQLDVALAALNGDSYGRKTGTRRKISAAGRARIAAAQRARWAKVRRNGGQKQNLVSMPKKKTMSAAARKKIAAAQRARWAKVKAAQKKSA
jgi:hypothetical protein